MDNREVLEIMEKFGQTGFAELRYKNGDAELALKRYPDTSAVTYALPPVTHTPVVSSSPISVPAATATPAVDSGAPVATINAPIVGTFYRTPAPDAPNFVDEGSQVKAGQVVCIIEAMKSMNQLEAEFDCTIVRALVPNATLVEYGTPLFEVIKK